MESNFFAYFCLRVVALCGIKRLEGGLAWKREWDSVNVLGSALVLMGSWAVHLVNVFVIAGVSLKAD